MEITTKQAIEHLTRALKSDPEFYEGYKSNIAMAFHDEYQKQVRGTLSSNLNIHQLSNVAADNFLKIWCATHD